METQRLILMVALMITGLLLWQSWEMRHSQPLSTQGLAYEGTKIPSALPVDETVPEMPPERNIAEVSSVTEQQLSTPVKAQSIRIVTDVLDIELSTAGGDVRKASLLQYPIELEKPDVVVQLMNDTMPRLFIGQSGLISRNHKLPDHHTVYQAEKSIYQLSDGDDQLQVNLSWQGDAGVTVIKQLTFKRVRYWVDRDSFIEHASGVELARARYRP